MKFNRIDVTQTYRPIEQILKARVVTDKNDRGIFSVTFIEQQLDKRLATIRIQG